MSAATSSVSDAIGSVARMTEPGRAREELDDLAGELAARGAMKGMIFGHHGLKTAARKMICFEHSGALVFKLTGAAYDDALALTGTCVFKPMADRPAMTGWVVVPPAHAKKWAELARTAHDQLAGG
jgi:hypothetical protein